MKKIITFVSAIILTTASVFSQVGINTTTPQDALDVRGSLQIRKDLNFPISTTDLESITPGQSQQYLVSRGANNPPQWITLPTVNYGIGENILVSDQTQGAYWQIPTSVTLPYIDGGGTYPYSFDFNSPITAQNNSNLSRWIVLDKFTQNLNITVPNTIVSYNMQSMVQLTSQANIAIAVVAVGIYVDDQLKTIRTVQVTGTGYTAMPINVMDALTLSPKANNAPYQMKLAVRLRYFGTPASDLADVARWVLFGLGIDYAKSKLGINLTEPTNTTGFMNGVHLALNIYEPNN